MNKTEPQPQSPEIAFHEDNKYAVAFFGLNFGVLIILFALFGEIIEVHFFFRKYNVYIIEWVLTKGEMLITS